MNKAYINIEELKKSYKNIKYFGYLAGFACFTIGLAALFWADFTLAEFTSIWFLTTAAFILSSHRSFCMIQEKAIDDIELDLKHIQRYEKQLLSEEE